MRKASPLPGSRNGMPMIGACSPPSGFRRRTAWPASCISARRSPPRPSGRARSLTRSSPASHRAGLTSARANDRKKPLFYRTDKNDHGLPHNPFKAIVAPRPSGWVTAMSRKGEINLSPYSYFNAVGDRPPIVVFSSDGMKDAGSFVEETGELVSNFVTYELREKMNLTSAPLPRGQNEMAFAGLTPAPSVLVKPPRVSEAPAALACTLLQ